MLGEVDEVVAFFGAPVEVDGDGGVGAGDGGGADEVFVGDVLGVEDDVAFDVGGVAFGGGLIGFLEECGVEVEGEVGLLVADDFSVEAEVGHGGLVGGFGDGGGVVDRWSGAEGEGQDREGEEEGGDLLHGPGVLRGGAGDNSDRRRGEFHAATQRPQREAGLKGRVSHRDSEGELVSREDANMQRLSDGVAPTSAYLDGVWVGGEGSHGGTEGRKGTLGSGGG